MLIGFHLLGSPAARLALTLVCLQRVLTAADPTVTLAWDPSTSANAVGYRIHYGFTNWIYPIAHDAGATTNVTISLPVAGVRYHFVATAYDEFRIDGDYSNSVTFDAPGEPPRPVEQLLETWEEEALVLPWGNGAGFSEDAKWYLIVPPLLGQMVERDSGPVYVPAHDATGSDAFSYFVVEETTAYRVRANISVKPVNDPPVASGGLFSAEWNRPVAVFLAGWDADSDKVSYEVIEPPVFGLLRGVGPDLVYEPQPGFTGQDSFRYVVRDGHVASEPASISIWVIPPMGRPVALDFEVLTLEEEAVEVLLEGWDPEGEPVEVWDMALPQHGSLVADEAGFVYVPNQDFYGSDGFEFRVSDDEGLTSEPASVRILVLPVNDPPEAQTLEMATSEDQPLAVTLEGGDVDGDSLSFEVLTPPQHGTLTGEGAAWVYSPAPDYNGPDALEYRALDEASSSKPAVVRISVRAVNDSPRAVDVDLTTLEDMPAQLPLTAVDVDGDPLSVEVVGLPGHGTLQRDDGIWVYDPDPDYHGRDAVQYVARDATSTSAPATVRIVVEPVNDPPSAVDLELTVREDTPLTFEPKGLDTDGDLVNCEIISEPAHGTLARQGLAWVYLPLTHYHGTDGFQYVVMDGQSTSDPGNVNIRVTGVNDSPQAMDLEVTTQEDTAVEVDLRGQDVDGDAVTFEVIALPIEGTLSELGQDISYTPRKDFHGLDEFLYVAHDGATNSEVAVVRIRVEPVNDPPEVNPLVMAGDEDQPLAITLEGGDVDGDTVTFEVFVAPQHGVLTGEGPVRLYMPEPNYHGPDTFQYRALDDVSSSEPAVVWISISAVNDPPRALDVDLLTLEDTPAPLPLAAVDVDGDPLGFEIVGLPSHGTLRRDDGIWVYDPDPDYHGGDVVQYVARDAASTSAPAMVRIVVEPVNDRPSAVDLELTVREDTPLTFEPKGLDTDGDLVNCEIISEPAHGTLARQGLAWVYLPLTHYHGTDGFQYVVMDGQSTSDPGNVNIRVTGVNDSPQAMDLEVTTQEDTAVEVDLRGQDVDGDAVTFEVIALPIEGTLSELGQDISYTPRKDFHGLDEFLYVAHDGATNSEVAVVRIRVEPVNDPPEVNPLVMAGDEDQPLAITLEGGDVDGDTVTFEVFVAPQHGVLTGEGPVRLYMPEPNYHGPDTFQYRALDDVSSSEPAVVWISISAVNDPPRALDVDLLTLEDTPAPLPLAAVDVDGDPLGFEIVGLPGHGTLQRDDGIWVYDPDPQYHGRDAVQYVARDATFTSAAATVRIVVEPVNDPPSAVDLELTAQEDTPLTFELQGQDADGEFVNYEIIKAAAHGTLARQGLAWVYQPLTHYHGTDSFQYVVTDGQSTSHPGNVSVLVTAVNDAPQAMDLEVTTQEDTAVAVDLRGQDVDGDSVTFEVVAFPSEGTLGEVGMGVRYTPRQDFHGPDEFRYVARDGTTNSDVAVVRIRVEPANDPPRTLDGDLLTLEDTPASLPLAAVDLDGDPVTFEVTVPPAHGIARRDGVAWVYEPDGDYHGDDVVQYVARDAVSASAPAVVRIRVEPVNDPPQVSDMDLTTFEDNPVGLELHGHDVDGDAVMLQVLEVPRHGSLIADGASWIYTPHQDFHGLDEFHYVAQDGATNSAPARVRIQVESVNDAPVARTIELSTDEDHALEVVLEGDDADGDILDFEIVAGPQHGTLTGEGDHQVYAPLQDFHGVEELWYRVFDGQAHSAPAMVRIVVSAVNDPPTVAGGSYLVVEGVPRELRVTAADADGDTLTFRLTQGPQHGTVSGEPPAVIYSPAAGYAGRDLIEFVASDGLMDSGTGVVEFDVRSKAEVEPHLSIRTGGGQIWLSWRVVKGASYRLWHRADLFSGEWVGIAEYPEAGSDDDQMTVGFPARGGYFCCEAVVYGESPWTGGHAERP